MTEDSAIALLPPAEAPSLHEHDIQRLAELIEGEEITALDEVVTLIARIAVPMDVLSD